MTLFKLMATNIKLTKKTNRPRRDVSNAFNQQKLTI